MIQTIVFHGFSTERGQEACNKAALEANKFLKTFEIGREQFISSTTNYVSAFYEPGGVAGYECTVTLVVDTQYTIIDLLTPHQKGSQSDEGEYVEF